MSTVASLLPHFILCSLFTMNKSVFLWSGSSVPLTSSSCARCVCVSRLCLVRVWSEDEVLQDEVIMTGCWELRECHCCSLQPSDVRTGNGKLRSGKRFPSVIGTEWLLYCGLWSGSKRFCLGVHSFTHNSIRYEASIIYEEQRCHFLSSLSLSTESQNMNYTVVCWTRYIYAAVCWYLGHKYKLVNDNPLWSVWYEYMMKIWNAHCFESLRGTYANNSTYICTFSYRYKMTYI